MGKVDEGFEGIEGFEGVFGTGRETWAVWRCLTSNSTEAHPIVQSPHSHFRFPPPPPPPPPPRFSFPIPGELTAEFKAEIMLKAGFEAGLGEGFNEGFPIGFKDGGFESFEAPMNSFLEGSSGADSIPSLNFDFQGDQKKEIQWKEKGRLRKLVLEEKRK